MNTEQQLTLPANTPIYFLSTHHTLPLPEATLVTLIEQTRGGWVVRDEDGDEFAITTETVAQLRRNARKERLAEAKAVLASRNALVRKARARREHGEISEEVMRKLIGEAHRAAERKLDILEHQEAVKATDKEEAPNGEGVTEDATPAALPDDLIGDLGFGAGQSQPAHTAPWGDTPPAPRKRPTPAPEPLPAAVEAMFADAAPVFERDGLPGLWVRSRTPEADRTPGEHQSAYHVTGAAPALACTCPAARRGRPCWHRSAVERAPSWEQAVRGLYGAVRLTGQVDELVCARAVVATWRRTLEAQAPTPLGKPDIVGAMRCFEAEAQAMVTRLLLQAGRRSARTAQANEHATSSVAA